jgi:hypothetical protein
MKRCPTLTKIIAALFEKFMANLQTKRTGEIRPPCPTPACIPRQNDVAVWKDASNIQPKGMMRWYGPGRMGVLGSLACKETVNPNSIDGFGHVEEDHAC